MEPIITFIITVPNTSVDYWDTLVRDTLFSVCSQTRSRYEVVVVSTKVHHHFENVPREGDLVLEEYRCGDEPTEVCEALLFIAGVRKASGRYIMRVPVGHFVSEQITAILLGMDKLIDGWLISQGVWFEGQRHCRVPWWDTRSHASTILKKAIYEKELALLPALLIPDKIEAYLHPFVFRSMFTLKGKLKEYCHALDYEVGTWPDEAAAGAYPHEEVKGLQMVPQFPSRRAPRWVYELNPPVADHLNERAGVHVTDPRCLDALRAAGYYNQFELDARNLHAVLGDSNWEDYHSVAYVRNPWDYVVAAFANREDKSIDLVNFLKTNPPRSQLSQVMLPGDLEVSEIRASEGVSEFPVYDGEYKEYYTQEAAELVAAIYEEDIETFNYEF